MSDQALQELSDHLQARLADTLLSARIELGELIITVQRASIVRVMTFLRDDSNCQFKQLIDLCGADYPITRRAFRGGLQSAQPEAQSAHPREGEHGRGHARTVAGGSLQRGALVRARSLGPVRHLLLRPSGSAPHPDRLRVRRASAAQGFPADRLCRTALRRRAEAGRLRAGQADAGFPLIRFPQPLGRHDQCHAAGRRKG